MKKLIKICVISMFLLSLVGCSKPNVEEYSGNSLNIGVIGETPKVREDKVSFENIEFNDLENSSLSNKYDAIFIIKDNLEEASKKEYAPIYNNCEVPFIFIESEKGLVPFVNEELSYKDVPKLSDPPSYAVGIYKEGKEVLDVEYGLYNDVKNEKNIEDVYSQIFTSIAQNKNKLN